MTTGNYTCAPKLIIIIIIILLLLLLLLFTGMSFHSVAVVLAIVTNLNKYT